MGPWTVQVRHMSVQVGGWRVWAMRRPGARQVGWMIEEEGHGRCTACHIGAVGLC